MTRPVSMVTRRDFLAGMGAFVVSFSIPGALAQKAALPAGFKLPSGTDESKHLDAWIRIDAAGQVTVFTGKAELGQGIKTALLQIAAEEVDVPVSAVNVITADTDLTPNEGFTSGSYSLESSGNIIRGAAAQLRALLVEEAAHRMERSVADLHTESGAVLSSDGTRLLYGDLVAEQNRHVALDDSPPFKNPDQYKVLNTSVPRVDIPAKVTGGAAYVQDLRLPGMLHARVIRPPSYGARLTQVKREAVLSMPGVVRVVHDGNFLAVVADQEYRSIKAMHALADTAQWEENATLPDQNNLYKALLALPAEDTVVLEKKGDAVGAKVIEARYTKPYHAHASIGPSCAVAQYIDGLLTIWSHTQGVFPDRDAIAAMLDMPREKIRCIHMEGSGCYGHNGADDAAADAAVIAYHIPGQPVRIQWMRDQEHTWEPFGPAMVMTAKAVLSDHGTVAEWQYDLWSNAHTLRPRKDIGALVTAQHIAKSFPPPTPMYFPHPLGSSDRNAVPLYTFSNTRVVNHFIPTMPLRVSALRSLGAYANVFSIESFMDELALAAGADPIDFRLSHLSEPRAREVITTAAERFGWQKRTALPRNHGYGMGFARYKNSAAYCAVCIEVQVIPATGEVRVLRAVAAVDAGQVVTPDGLSNQIEGGIVQSLSWTLYEAVQFDNKRITSVDWQTYPILRFDTAPHSLEVHILNRPGQPFLGAGEASQGPTAAAVANAFAHATGKRLRDLPLSPERIKTALNVEAPIDAIGRERRTMS